MSRIILKKAWDEYNKECNKAQNLNGYEKEIYYDIIWKKYTILIVSLFGKNFLLYINTGEIRSPEKVAIPITELL